MVHESKKAIGRRSVCTEFVLMPAGLLPALSSPHAREEIWFTPHSIT